MPALIRRWKFNKEKEP